MGAKTACNHSSHFLKTPENIFVDDPPHETTLICDAYGYRNAAD